MEAGTHVTRATPGARPLGVARRRWGEEAIRALLFLAALISILTTLGIVFALVEESLPFFREVGAEFFAFTTGRRSSTRRRSGSGSCSTGPS